MYNIRKHRGQKTFGIFVNDKGKDSIAYKGKLITMVTDRVTRGMILRMISFNHKEWNDNKIKLNRLYNMVDTTVVVPNPLSISRELHET